MSGWEELTQREKVVEIVRLYSLDSVPSSAGDHSFCIFSSGDREIVTKIADKLLGANSRATVRRINDYMGVIFFPDVPVLVAEIS